MNDCQVEQFRHSIGRVLFFWFNSRSPLSTIFMNFTVTLLSTILDTTHVNMSSKALVLHGAKDLRLVLLPPCPIHPSIHTHTLVLVLT